MKQERHNKRILIKALITGLFLVAVFQGIAFSATFTVNSTADAVDASPGNGICETATGNGVCTLRAAIQEANALTGADTIILPAGTYTLSIAGAGEDAAATGDLDINSDLTINGAGAATTIIDGGGIDRVFFIFGGTARSVTISGVTIRGGDATVNSVNKFGGGIYVATTGALTVTLTDSIVRNNLADNGGGILTINTLTLTNVTVAANNANSSGGGIHSSANASVTVSISNSTISGNTSSYGGGIYNDYSILLITNSTISGNSSVMSCSLCADGSGGGIDNNANGGKVTLTNVTIANNTAENWGAGIYHYTDTFGSAVNMINTIIAGNTQYGNPSDCNGSILFSQGYNFIQDTSGCTINGTTTGNITSQNPQLGPLADNSGATQTHALLPGSPAIDAGNNSVCPAADQRGVARQDGNGDSTVICDMGSYEAMFTPQPNISVSLTSYDFGGITVGSSAAALVITISNTGTANLNITGMTLSDTANYSLNANGGSNPCGSTTLILAASNNCTITVTFAPQSTGVINAMLTISSNDSDTPNQNISLTGAGAAQTGGNTGGGGGGGGGGCGGFIQDSGNKNRENSSLILSFVLMLIISLTGASLARRVIRA